MATAGIHTARVGGAGCECGFIKLQSLDSLGISGCMCWTKAKRHQAKRQSGQQRLQRRLPEGTRAPMGPLEGRNIQDGLGKGRESPGPGLAEEEKGWTPTPFAVAVFS